eukprot:8654932-Pyramimonas_sp.AAC.2
MPVIGLGYACVAPDGADLCPRTPTCWTGKTEEVDGKTFIQTNKCDTNFKKYLGTHGLKMVEELTRLRNHATDSLMSSADSKDILGDAVDDDGVQRLKRSRKDLYDEIAQAVDVEVVTIRGDRVKVSVLTTANKRARLSLELTDSNMALLTTKPDNSQAPYVPRVGDHCEWLQHRFSVRRKYFDGAKWRQKSMKVSQEGDLQSEVDKTCSVLLEYRSQYHAQP